jgi:predicted Zn-dependent protease
VKERILQTLRTLRTYALGKACDISLFYREEDSYLMRFANSVISLNTNEHLIRLDVEAVSGKQRANYSLITDLSKVEEMKKAIDTAAELVKHAQPLSYQPTVATYQSSFEDESCYDPALAKLSSEEKLEFFNRAVKGLETADLKLSGIFSCGENIVAQITTRSEHTQFFHTSDAQVTIVLAHAQLKWEVTAEQSAQQKADLDAAKLHAELDFLLKHYQTDPAQQLPLGQYDIVFGAAAISDMLRFLMFIGFSGGAMKRGYSCLSEDKIGQRVFSEQITINDDPSRRETFPFRRDYLGIPRNLFPFVKQGVFQGFAWMQDDADEFGAKATGHTVHHQSLSVNGGQQKVSSLAELLAMPRTGDILYIPFLHYMNLVNPSKGVFTGSSRFGALLLKQDGSVVVPYNVRLTQSLLDIFGDKVAWLAQETTVYNESMSYGARNPTALIVPSFMRVNGLEISHSNTSY